MRASLTVLVLVLNVVAAVSILGAPTTTGRKLAWLAGVTWLPLAGALAWLVAGRRNHGGSISPTEPVSRA
ncbi:MAG TPA: PLD nuclease N-terminal domain-containing protein [Longimicrobiales bacterium]|nr:PLD nuclease N-terminal domain-containing protein [Longimicrobiales bacterium]